MASDLDEQFERARSKIRLRTGSDRPLAEGAPPPAPSAGDPLLPAAAQEPAAEQPELLPGMMSDCAKMESFPLSDHARLGVAVGVVVMVAVAVLASPSTTVMAFLLAYLVAATLGRLAAKLVELQVPRRRAGVVAGLLAVGVVAVVLLFFAPVWERQGRAYGAQVVKLVGNVAELAEAREPWPAWLVAVLNTVTGTIYSLTRAVSERQVKVFVQIASWMGVFLAVILWRPVAPGNGLQKAWSTAARLCLKWLFKAELWATSRLGKALGLWLVAGIGLQMSGIPAAWFVAGWVLAFGWLLRATPLLTVLLAAPMLPWDASVLRTSLVVFGTGAVMFFLERKLHWYLYTRPGLAGGLIQPETSGAWGMSGSANQLIRDSAKFLRMAMTVAVVGLIAVALWAIVPSYQQQEARQKKIAAATNLVEKGELEKAIKRFALLETKFPNEREVFLGLAKAYAQKEDFTNATRYAELYADWKPKPPETRTTREKLSQRFMNLFETSTPSFNHTEAHEYILTQGKQGDQPSDLHRNLALRTLAINPDSLPAITLLIKESILRNKAEEAISYAERAVKLDPHGLNRHLELARACQMKQDWARVITECDAELATHPSNESATELRKMAVNAGGTLPQQPVPAPPAATPAAESN